MNKPLEKWGDGEGPDRWPPRLFGAVSGWGTLLAIEDRIFTEWRLRFYGSGVVVAYVIAIAWVLFKNEWSILVNGKPGCTDFGRIWLSGGFAASSDPAQVYNYAAFSAAQLHLFGPENCSMFFHFVYPPTFLFFTYPLGLMPYSVAFAVWKVVTLVFYLGAAYAIVPRWGTIILVMTPPVALVNLDIGQNGFLTAALMGLSLVFLRRRRWWLSTIFLGFLTYKPQFGVLFPLAFLASRNWRALGSTAAVSVALGVAAAIAFGYQGWQLFFDTLRDRNSSLSLDPGLDLTFQSVYGLLSWAGASDAISWTLHLAVAAVVTLAICTVWASQIPYALKAAILCIGSVAVTPYVHAYDLCVLSIAVAFLVSDGLSRGYLPGERTAILVCFIGLFCLLRPIAPVIYAILFFLTVRRAVTCRRALPTSLNERPLVAGSPKVAS